MAAPNDSSSFVAMLLAGPEVLAETARLRDLDSLLDDAFITDCCWDDVGDKAVADVWRVSLAAVSGSTRRSDTKDAIAAPHLGGEHAVGVGTPPRTAKQPHQPRKRASKKTEIEALRVEAAMLEEELMREREHWKRKSAAVIAASGRSTECGAMTPADGVWKPIARRQRETLSESEMLNRELRWRLQMQRKRLQRVRKLLAKRVAVRLSTESTVVHGMNQSLTNAVSREWRAASCFLPVRSFLSQGARACSTSCCEGAC